MSDASTDEPLQDTLELMTDASIANCRLGTRELMLVRFAALVAADARAASYAVNIGAVMAADVQVTRDDAAGCPRRRSADRRDRTGGHCDCQHWQRPGPRARNDRRG